MNSFNNFPDEFGGLEPDNLPKIVTTLDRWRFALVAFAVLMTVVAVGVLSSSSDESSSEIANPDVVVDSSLVPLITVPLERTLELGMKGDDVLRLQQRLKDLKFDPGPVDGEFGQNTVQAMWAFEKLVLGVPREQATGVVTASTWSIMQSNLKFKPRRVADSPNHVEVYLPEQVLIVFSNQEPVLITHMSSGTEEPWCEEVKIDPGEEGNKTDQQIKIGICGEAVTPPGLFYFYNRRTGMRETKLGSLYNPVYFNYNIAVHGRFSCRSSRLRMAVFEYRCRWQGIFRRSSNMATVFIFLTASKNQKNMARQLHRLTNQIRITRRFRPRQLCLL